MTKALPYHQASLKANLGTTFEVVLLTISRFKETEFNMVPFAGSWTAAQVTDHLTLSNLSITRALALPGSPINRDPGERIAELKDVFLDFGKKFQAPSFILPAGNHYNMEETVTRFRHSLEQILKLVEQTDLSTMINHDAFGDITKLEVLHFVLYHTQRHREQLERIHGTFTQHIINH